MRTPIDPFWSDLIKRGPLCLTNEDWREIHWKLREVQELPAITLGRFLGHLEQEAKWIVQMREEWEGEANRIRRIGLTMRKAGLRSYTDEQKRIYVAARRKPVPRQGEEK